MRITLGLFGYEVFSLTVNDPNEAAYAADFELAGDDPEPDDPEDDDPEGPSGEGRVFDKDTMHFYGSVESTVVDPGATSTWEDRGSLHQFDPDGAGEDARRVGFTRS